MHDLVDLVQRARAGDATGQDALVRQFHGMAVTYACGVLGNRADAEDVAQDAFLEAFRCLDTLRDPARFGAWLRGIVRYRALHLIRDARAQVPLEAGTHVPADGLSVEGEAEVRARIEALLAALARLPEGDRIAATMTLLSGASQAEVAAFLVMNREAVNNRMRRIRRVLRQQGVIPMGNDRIDGQGAGRVLAARAAGVTVSLGGADGKLFDRVAIGDGASAGMMAMIAEVVGDDVFRTILGDAEAGDRVDAGTSVMRTDVAATSLGVAAAARFLDGLETGESSRSLETGILGVDLFASATAGGSLVIAGDSNVGKVVLAEELVHRLGPGGDQLHVVVCVGQASDPGDAGITTAPRGQVDVSYLLLDDPSTAAIAPLVPAGVALVSLARAVAAREIWPAIDVAASRGAGADSADVAAARAEMRQGGDRADAVQRLVAQPFYVAEPYTKRLGVTLSRRTAAARLRGVLEG